MTYTINCDLCTPFIDRNRLMNDWFRKQPFILRCSNTWQTSFEQKHSSRWGMSLRCQATVYWMLLQEQWRREQEQCRSILKAVDFLLAVSSSTSASPTLPSPLLSSFPPPDVAVSPSSHPSPLLPCQVQLIFLGIQLILWGWKQHSPLHSSTKQHSPSSPSSTK